MLPGELQARYQIRAELGRGSFGVVYRVLDVEAGAERALKLLELQGDGAREAREIAVSRELDHPHLVRFHAGGVVGRLAYLVMDLAEGSLQGAMGDAPRAWSLLKQAASGVAALHAAGLVHRDLKPENILLVGGSARVGDLGLVRGGAHQTLTATGTIMGSPVWMAPEQARGERPTPASDAWALGVMAYQIVEGAPPYPDLPLGELLARVARGQRDSVQRARSRLEPEGVRVLDAALALDPKDRPGDLEAWAAALGELDAVPAAASDMLQTQVLEEGPAEATRAVTGAIASGPKHERPTQALPVSAPAPRTQERPPASQRVAAPMLIAGVFLFGILFGVLLPSRVPPGAPGASPAPSATDPAVPGPRQPDTDPSAEAAARRQITEARHDDLRKSYQALTAQWERDPGYSEWGVGDRVPCALVVSYGSPEFRRLWRDHLEALVSLVRALEQDPDVALPRTPGLRVAGRDLVRVVLLDLVEREVVIAQPYCLGVGMKRQKPRLPGEMGMDVEEMPVMRSKLEADGAVLALTRARRELGAVRLPGSSRWAPVLSQIRLEMDAVLVQALEILGTRHPELRPAIERLDLFPRGDLEVLTRALADGAGAPNPGVGWTTLRSVVERVPCDRKVEALEPLVSLLRTPHLKHPSNRRDLWEALIDAWRECEGERAPLRAMAGRVVEPLLASDQAPTLWGVSDLWRHWIQEGHRRVQVAGESYRHYELPSWAPLREELESWLRSTVLRRFQRLAFTGATEREAWTKAIHRARAEWSDERTRYQLLEESDPSPEAEEFYDQFGRLLRELARGLERRRVGEEAGDLPSSVSAARSDLVSSAFDWTDGFDFQDRIIGLPLRTPVTCAIVEDYARPDWEARWTSHLDNWLRLATAAMGAGVGPDRLGLDMRRSGARLAEIIESDLEDRSERRSTGGRCWRRSGQTMGSDKRWARSLRLEKGFLRGRRSQLHEGLARAANRLAASIAEAPPRWADFLRPTLVRWEGVLVKVGEPRPGASEAAAALLDALAANPGGPEAGVGWFALTRWLGHVGAEKDCELRLRAVDAAGVALGRLDHHRSRRYLAECFLGQAAQAVGTCPGAEAPGPGVLSLLEHLVAESAADPGDPIHQAMKFFRGLYKKRDDYGEALVASSWAPVRARLREVSLEALRRMAARPTLTRDDFVDLADAIEEYDRAFEPDDFHKVLGEYRGRSDRAGDAGIRPPPEEWDEAEVLATRAWRKAVWKQLEAIAQRGRGAEGALR